MNIKPIKVFIIDDSLVFRETLKSGLIHDYNFDVVGTAADARSAFQMIEKSNPDVVTVDVEMPGMNGIEFVKELLLQYPVPVVMVSSLDKRVFEAMSAGAVDFVVKPGPENMGVKGFLNELAAKVRIAAGSRIGAVKNTGFRINGQRSTGQKTELIAIGASTGGTEAILRVIQDLPGDVPGIVIVQHIPPMFSRMFAERMNNMCKLRVKEALNGDEAACGTVLVAPGDAHMTVVKDGGRYIVRCRRGEKVSGHCPSVNVLFDSVADSAGNRALGVILTGMGSDGAKGLLKMRQKGAYTIGQDESSSVVYGMPMEAYKLGAVAKQMPLLKISEEILRNI